MQEDGGGIKDVSSKSSNTTLYFIFAIVLLLVSGAAFWLGKSMSRPPAVQLQSTGGVQQRTGGPPSLKGQQFSDTPFFSQAVQIYPGTISPDAQKVMSGWTLKTKTSTDGTTQADLIPVGSEATEGDTAHTFILKDGYKLYFVDLNPSDDGPKDQNTHDDMGIVVDASGTVQ